jgi:hypothetical protein
MWQPDEKDFRALQALGLLAMALFIGVRVVPGGQRHRRRIVAAALVLYLAGGLAYFLWRLAQG